MHYDKQIQESVELYIVCKKKYLMTYVLRMYNHDTTTKFQNKMN